VQTAISLAEFELERKPPKIDRFGRFFVVFTKTPPLNLATGKQHFWNKVVFAKLGIFTLSRKPLLTKKSFNTFPH